MSLRPPAALARAAEPNFLVGYLAWAVVAVGLWRNHDPLPAVGPISGRLCALALLGCFLTAFIALSSVADGAVRDAHGRTAVIVVALMGSTFGLLVLGPYSLAPILLIVIAVVLMAAYPPRTAWSLLIAVNAAFLAVIVCRWHVDDPGFTLAIYGSFQVFAAVTSGARNKAEAATAELQQVNAQLLATRALLAETARDGERLRVSRELHDLAGHKLTALSLNLELLGHDPLLAERREFALTRDLTRELLADIRSVVTSLRHGDGIEITEALRQIAAPFPHPIAHIQVGPALRVDDADCAEALLGVWREALTNSARHAKARNVWLSIERRGSALELAIEDDGLPRPAVAAGNGLRGMQERVESINGTLVIDRGRTGGVRLRVRVPTRNAS